MIFYFEIYYYFASKKLTSNTILRVYFLRQPISGLPTQNQQSIRKYTICQKIMREK